jgi:hypothetical protein
MDLASSLLKGATAMAGGAFDSVTAFLGTLAEAAGLFPDDGPDGTFGLLMSGLAGVAAAVAVAIALNLYFRSRYRSARDIIRHGLALALALGLLAFVAYDLRHAAFAYLGINPASPAVEFEIRLPKEAAALAETQVQTQFETQVELHTDRNQTLARIEGGLLSDRDGRSVLRGSVALEFRTTDRVIILNLPGPAQYRFKLRLAASPSCSDQFGPWHLADRVVAPGDPEGNGPNDAFAIRYRVL